MRMQIPYCSCCEQQGFCFQSLNSALTTKETTASDNKWKAYILLTITNHYNVPGQLSRQSMRLLISGSWVRAPRWAPFLSRLIKHFMPIVWALLPTKRNLGPVYTTSKEFENGDFTLKTHQMFSVHTTLENQYTGYFRFVSQENSVKENSIIIVTPSFSKSSVFKMFPSTRKRKVGVFKFLQFQEPEKDEGKHEG